MSLRSEIRNTILFETRENANRLLDEKFPGYSVFAIRDNGRIIIHYHDRFSFVIITKAVPLRECDYLK